MNICLENLNLNKTYNMVLYGSSWANCLINPKVRNELLAHTKWNITAGINDKGY